MAASLNGTKESPNNNGVKPSLAADAWEKKEGGKLDNGHNGGYGGHSSLGDKIK